MELSDHRIERDTSSSYIRVLIVHRNLLGREEEAGEVRELVTSLLVSSDDESVLQLWATDCRSTYKAQLVNNEVEYQRSSSILAEYIKGFDIAHIYMPIPVLHLITAVLLKLRRTAIVLSPMSVLSDDFAQASWFRQSSKIFLWFKPLLIRLLRRCWHSVVDYFVCISAEEIKLSHLPRGLCAIAPWLVPKTSLAEAIRLSNRRVASGGALDRPIAFVSRFDTWRKGIDRLCAWLSAYERALPRPAAVLFSPVVSEWPPAVQRLVERGVLVWDTSTRGSDLLPRLEGCRGIMLLSRFEGQPRVLREAAILGLPTISTPSCHFAEVVEFLGVGAVVDGDDKEAIQAAFERIANDPPGAERAEVLFDRKSVGTFLRNVLVSVATGTHAQERSYYHFINNQITRRENEGVKVMHSVG